MRVFVVGASGVIGSRLVPQLIERGHEVIGSARSPALTIMAGSPVDRLGRKLVFTVELAAFTAASFVAGLATDALTLNLARGLQGTRRTQPYGDEPGDPEHD